MNMQDSIDQSKTGKPVEQDKQVMETTGSNHIVVNHDQGCTCEEHTEMPGTAVAVGTLAATLALASCKKDEETLFEINDVALYGSAAEKDKQKTNQQYVSILYTNLFQTALSGNDVFNLNNCFLSIGDQELAREVLISNYFNQEGVQLPTIEEMNADIDAFIEDTYKRFFVRYPTEAEKTWIKNFIQGNPFMTPELVFFSFALSNEYLFY
jgi:hypothetical protein